MQAAHKLEIDAYRLQEPVFRFQPSVDEMLKHASTFGQLPGKGNPPAPHSHLHRLSLGATLPPTRVPAPALSAGMLPGRLQGTAAAPDHFWAPESRPLSLVAIRWRHAITS